MQLRFFKLETVLAYAFNGKIMLGIRLYQSTFLGYNFYETGPLVYGNGSVKTKE